MRMATMRTCSFPSMPAEPSVARSAFALCTRQEPSLRALYRSQNYLYLNSGDPSVESSPLSCCEVTPNACEPSRLSPVKGGCQINLISKRVHAVLIN